MFPMKPSRMWLLCEVSWAFIALSLAWTGAGLWPLQGSWLHDALDKRGRDEIWAIMLAVPSIGLMVFSVREYVVYRWPSPDIMRRWGVVQMDSSAKMRGRFAFFVGCGLLYSFYASIHLSLRTSPLVPIALGGAVFMFASWVENRRVQRDVRKATTSFPASRAQA